MKFKIWPFGRKWDSHDLSGSQPNAKQTVDGFCHDYHGLIIFHVWNFHFKCTTSRDYSKFISKFSNFNQLHLLYSLDSSIFLTHFNKLLKQSCWSERSTKNFLFTRWLPKILRPAIHFRCASNSFHFSNSVAIATDFVYCRIVPTSEMWSQNRSTFLNDFKTNEQKNKWKIDKKKIRFWQDQFSKICNKLAEFGLQVPFAKVCLRTCGWYGFFFSIFPFSKNDER